MSGADGEHMTPRAVAALAGALFADERSVRVRIVAERAEIEAHYPLFAAVDRAANATERHRGEFRSHLSQPKVYLSLANQMKLSSCDRSISGCIVFLEYTPESHSETVMLVGKVSPPARRLIYAPAPR